VAYSQAEVAAAQETVAKDKFKEQVRQHTAQVQHVATQEQEVQLQLTQVAVAE
jgi:hypothetical protein